MISQKLEFKSGIINTSQDLEQQESKPIVGLGN